MRIAINGAGIAGPTLAYWLERTGHEVLLIEAAPTLRTGGYVIDFWGMGYDIAERMGLVPRIRELGYQVREVRFVDRTGRLLRVFRVEYLRGRWSSTANERKAQLRRCSRALGGNATVRGSARRPTHGAPVISSRAGGR